MTGHEQALLARAEALEDTGELVQSITTVLAGAQEAGTDPAAVTSLQGAVRALDPGASTGYDAGGKQDRQPGGGYRSDGEFLEAAAEAEGDALDRLREAEQLQEQLAAAMDAAQAALDAAYAMPVKDECDGCHGIKEAAIAAALHRTGLCKAAVGILDPLAGRLRVALDGSGRSPRTSGRSTSWCTRSSARAASCPSTAGGSEAQRYAHKVGRALPSTRRQPRVDPQRCGGKLGHLSRLGMCSATELAAGDQGISTVR